MKSLTAPAAAFQAERCASMLAFAMHGVLHVSFRRPLAQPSSEQNVRPYSRMPVRLR
jgi:hypothetical protein